MCIAKPDEILSISLFYCYMYRKKYVLTRYYSVREIAGCRVNVTRETREHRYKTKR